MRARDCARCRLAVARGEVEVAVWSSLAFRSLFAFTVRGYDRMFALTLRGTAHARRLTRALSTRSSGILSSLGLPTSGEPVAGVYHHHAQGWHGCGEVQHSISPATGETLARVQTASPEEVDAALASARRAYESWRTVPAPKRGEVLRQVRVALNERIDDLGKLVSLEMGKVLSGENHHTFQ